MNSFLLIATALFVGVQGITVVVVRHGEKGSTSHPGKGDLTPDGYKRASYLANCFGKPNSAIPDASDQSLGIIYADGGKSAQREKELMLPLKNKNHISFFEKCALTKGIFSPIMHKCAQGHVEDAQRQGKQTVLLSWEHVDIPHLVSYLIGGNHPAWPNSCGSWPGDGPGNSDGNTAGCYDQIWMFKYEPAANVSVLEEGFAGSETSCNIHQRWNNGRNTTRTANGTAVLVHPL